MSKAKLILSDGSSYDAFSFGYEKSVSGELVFYTAMTGYPESLSDPSYKGQILIPTYPMIGNYGVPGDVKENGLSKFFESDRIQCTGLIISDYSQNYSHWDSARSLGAWLKAWEVPGLYGLDTRALTKKLREKGAMLGKIVFDGVDPGFYDPDTENLVEQVSCKEVQTFGTGRYKVLMVDCGMKNNIIRCLLKHDVTVTLVPWNYDFRGEDYDGLFVSNGPGNPALLLPVIEHLKSQRCRSDIDDDIQVIRRVHKADCSHIPIGVAHAESVDIIGSSRRHLLRISIFQLKELPVVSLFQEPDCVYNVGLRIDFNIHL